MSATWLDTLLQHSHWPALLVFLLLWLESAPFTGLLILGIALVTSLGALVATQQLSYAEIMLAASLGAVAGDLTGFLLGKRLGQHALKARYQQQRRHSLEKLQGWIQEYGLPGIAAGRFLWFVHPLVPGIAGASGLSLRWFLLADIPTAILWMNLYLGVGWLVAGLWSDHSPQLLEALIFSLLACLALAAVLLIYHRIHGKTQP